MSGDVERGDAADQLRRSQAYFEAAQRLSGAGSWALDIATRRFVHWSEEQNRLHGFQAGRSDPVWADVQQQIHPDDRARCVAQVDSALRDAAEWRLEYRCLLPDGATKVIQSIARPVRDGQGRPLEFVGTDIDITDRKRVEEDLRESEARFRTFVDHAADAFLLHDTADFGRILDVNRQACESLGYAREDLIGRYPREFDVGLSPEEVIAIGKRVAAGEVFAFETIHRRKDGTEFPVELRVRPFQQRGLSMSVALARNISDRKEAQRALSESHDLLHAVVEGSPDAILVKDLQGRYRMINSAAARLLGKRVEDVIGKMDDDLFAPDRAQELRKRDLHILATGETETFEETVRDASGTRIYLSTTAPYRDQHGNVIGLVRIARDVTELKSLESDLRQAQKMEAVGRLAGGVAHDFNNLLLVITVYTEMVVNDLRPNDPNRSLLYEVQRAGERATTLTRQLLAFSRRQVLQPKVISVNPLLVDLCRMLQRLIGSGIELSVTPDPELGLATVDPGQFEQAIINLTLNARDALSGSGQIRVQTRNASLDASYTERHPDVRPGDYVVVSVSDTGHGMDEQTRTQIFEPFFTTKESGKGTGLGLSMVYGFVKQSGGHIEVESEPDRGTSFTLYLPRTPGGAVARTPAEETSPIPRGDETILLVEDEEAVRTLTRVVLQSFGYKVLDARDGQDALSIVEAQPRAIDIVVTDMLMPRMGGRQLAEQLMQVAPNMRILFMSGYTDDVGLQRGGGGPGAGFIAKPFSPLALARKVRQILDGG